MGRARARSAPGWGDLHPVDGEDYVFSFGAVPEPAAWALMLVGFAGLGVALRARPKTAAA